MSDFAKALRYALVLVAGTISLVSCTADAESPMVVSTDWVAERLDDDNLVLIQVGEKELYDAAHLPGAHHMTREMIAITSDDDLSVELPPVAHLDSVFESIGVSDDSRIVLYWGEDWVTTTARVFFTLDYLGLGSRTSIMDGGLPAWVDQGRIITAALPEAHMGSITPNPRQDLVVHADWLADRLDDPAVVLLDARGPEYFTGELAPDGYRAGHIPSAFSMPYEDLLDQETLTFKDAETLQALFASAGAGPDSRLVSYCHVGQRASVVYFIARTLGYDVSLYDGSINDWGHREDLPMQTSTGI
jgi:thiosulfate/3-mercaptopyruvate sulfurtransferase